MARIGRDLLCGTASFTRASATVAPTQGGPARLADRALQAVWQARLQMRRRPRAWPQVLNTCDSARLQNLEALATKRMEGMADFRPS